MRRVASLLRDHECEGAYSGLLDVSGFVAQYLYIYLCTCSRVHQGEILFL